MEVLKSWSILLGREGLAVLVKAGEFFTEQAASGEAKPEMLLFLPTGQRYVLAPLELQMNKPVSL